MVLDRDRDWDAELSGLGDSGDEIRLTEDELLLLDWILCSQSGLLLASTIDGLMEWKDFRLAVWEALAVVGDAPSMGAMIEVPDLHVLLAVAPTSFNWGGVDNCGITLKAKLSSKLSGTWVDPQVQRDVDDQREWEEAAKAREEEAIVAAAAAAEALLNPAEDLRTPEEGQQDATSNSANEAEDQAPSNPPSGD